MHKLPSIKEMAEAVLYNVVLLHSFFRNITFDWFIASFWKEFHKLVEASASLSSGYHPKSNGLN